MKTSAFAAFATALLVPTIASAESYIVAPGEDLAAALSGLAPGDEVVLAPGEHAVAGGLDVTLDGSAVADITIRGQSGAFLSSTTDSPTLRISGSFVTVRDLEIQGAGVALALVGDGFTVTDNVFSGASGGIDCEDCVDVIIAYNEFLGLTAATSGAIVSDAFVNSLVRDNWIHDSGGAGIDVTNSVGSTFSDNVIEATSGTALSVSVPTATDAQGAMVAGNYIVGSGANGIAVDGPATVVNNIVSTTVGIGLLSTTQVGVRPVEILHNTVFGAQICFNAVQWSLSEAINVVSNNAFYCEGGDAIRFEDGVGMQTLVGVNVFLGTTDFPGDSFQGNGTTDFVVASAGDFYPSAESPLIDAGDPNSTVASDFNGTSRDSSPDVGAYEVTSLDNPAAIPDGFKNAQAAGGDDDAGTTSSDPDAGTTGPSGGASGGASGFPERDPQGCGCSSTSPANLIWGLLALGLLGFRRRR